MINVLYLDDYINFYSYNLKKIVFCKPYQNTLYNGRIIDKQKFIKSFVKMQKENNIKNNLLSESIVVITSPAIKECDKLLINEILEETNYKKINFKNEIDLLKLVKQDIFINYNKTYFYMYYIDDLGKYKTAVYENNFINKEIFSDIIDKLNPKNVYITGKDCQEGIKILEKNNYNYYYFDDNFNFFIKLYKLV